MEKQKIILICNICLSRNYSILKEKSNPHRLELKKYCRPCNKHTLHKETR